MAFMIEGFTVIFKFSASKLHKLQPSCNNSRNLEKGTATLSGQLSSRQDLFSVWASARSKRGILPNPMNQWMLVGCPFGGRPAACRPMV